MCGAIDLHRIEQRRQLLLRAGNEAQCWVPWHYAQCCELCGAESLGAGLEILPAGTQEEVRSLAHLPPSTGKEEAF